MNMNVLVTGGAGFIGSHTVVELINSGYDVVIADNLCNSREEVIDRIEKITHIRPSFYKIDLLDVPALETVFKENHIDAVIHFAGLKSGAESIAEPGRYLNSNLMSSFNLLNMMEKYNVFKLVFSSSATVYGTPEVVPDYETDMVGKVCSPYGFSKYLIELLLNDFTRQRDNYHFVALRYFNPIGAHPSGIIGEDDGQTSRTISFLTSQRRFLVNFHTFVSMETIMTPLTEQASGIISMWLIWQRGILPHWSIWIKQQRNMMCLILEPEKALLCFNWCLHSKRFLK